MPVKDNMKRISITLDDVVLIDLDDLCFYLDCNRSKVIAVLIEFVCYQYNFGRFPFFDGSPSTYIDEFEDFIQDHCILEGSSITFKDF